MSEAKHKNLEDLIKNIEIFEGLETRDINKVLKVANGKSFQANQKIFCEGDKGDSFYLIVEGKVRIVKQMANENTEEVAVLQSGDYFGEMSLLDGEPRSASVIALEDSKLLEIRNSQFIKLIMEDDNFARKVLWAFCMTFARRLRATNTLLAELAKKS